MRLMKLRRAGGSTDSVMADEQLNETAADSTRRESLEATAGLDTDRQLALQTGRARWAKVLGSAVLPVLALVLAAGVGVLKWQDTSLRSPSVDGAESVKAASEATIALLSYKPETVEQDLERGRAGLTGEFLDAYTSLTKDVVVPGSKQKQISAVATVPAAASVSATPDHAVALLFVNQTVIVGNDAPAGTSSSVRVTLDKVGGRWLISGFDPV